MIQKPQFKPQKPYFSSGPTSKHPGWELALLPTNLMGRSHRSREGLARIQELLALTRLVLEIPDDYHIAVLPGSCTNAMEAALWSLLGPRPVDFLAFDVFGRLWVYDGLEELKLPEARVFQAPAGEIPTLEQVDFNHDVVVTWNGTTTGAKIPDGNWIPDSRQGLVICDATSALFSMAFPWEKMDAIAFSWQKGLGGEAAHGMLALSPKALERLESYTPPWPMPRVFRLKNEEGKFNKALFEGMTINTPSLLCIEDCLDALKWCLHIGGLTSLIERSKSHLDIVEEWVYKTDWIEFLTGNPLYRSSSSICLFFPEDPTNWELPKKIAQLLSDEKIAYDILGHIHSVPNLRLWGGPTVEAQDIRALLPWIEWAYGQVK